MTYIKNVKKFNLRKVTRTFAKKYKSSARRRAYEKAHADNTEKIVSRVNDLCMSSASSSKGRSSPVVIIEENAPSSGNYPYVYPGQPQSGAVPSSDSGVKSLQQPGVSVSQMQPAVSGESVNAASVGSGPAASYAGASGGSSSSSPAPENKLGKGKTGFKEDIESIDLDNLEVKTVRVRKELSAQNFMKTDIKYPLTPASPKQGEKVYAWANVVWDKKANSLRYNVVEPLLSPQDKDYVSQIKKVIEEEIDVDFKSFSKESSESYVVAMMDKIIKRFKMGIDASKLEIYKYYVVRDFIGLGRMQPLLNDSQIEDISCDGVGIPIYVYHRDPKLGSLQTNVIFGTHDELDKLVMRISQKTGRSISMAEPILQGSLPDGSRVQATLGTDIASKGSNITIRRFLKEPLTPVHLINFGTLDSRMLAYLWLAIEHGKSVLIVGATASGKTSVLNALSMFIKPTAKVVSIEDTPELKLSHEHWIPEVARAGFGEADTTGKHRGEVSMFDLLKSSLRQRPDYIVVGEIRGVEASVLFQQIATGHPGISTFHADSFEKVIDRLVTRPISLSKSLIETLDMLIFVKRVKLHNGYVRRMTQVQEIKGYDSEKDIIMTNKPFEWDAFEDKFITTSDSYLLGKISVETGVSVNQLKDQMQQRMKVLEWMSENFITNFVRVNEVIKAYYNDTATLMEIIGEDYDIESS
ncbi:MAG: type II/IV secretion system ATPase subunit [archaeon]|nr:type II/IV secretion system ATPase subunit [archaeon]